MPNESGESNDFLFSPINLLITTPGVQESNITINSADITWDTSMSADTRVYASPGAGWESAANISGTTFNGIAGSGDSAVAVGAVNNVYP